MIEIERAYSEVLDDIVSIHDFERGDEIYQGRFKCDKCDSELIARKGTINAHHFASKTPHEDDCEHLQRQIETQKGVAKYVIDLDRFSYRDENPVLPGDTGGGRPEGSTNKNAFTHMKTLKEMVELDQFLVNGDITREDIKGIGGRNWDNFFIKQLDKKLISKIEENEERNSHQVFVFKGKVSKVWNNAYGAHVNIKGTRFDNYASSIQLRILHAKFTEEAQEDFNNKAEQNMQEMAVIGVPEIRNSENRNGQKFKKVLIEIEHEKWKNHVYQFDG